MRYNKLIEKTRLNESKKQVEAIRRGILHLVPEKALCLLSWKELELKVCGKGNFDI